MIRPTVPTSLLLGDSSFIDKEKALLQSLPGKKREKDREAVRHLRLIDVTTTTRISWIGSHPRTGINIQIDHFRSELVRVFLPLLIVSIDTRPGINV